MKFLKKTYPVVLVLLLLSVSCSEDEKVDPGTPPEIPPVETMVMDFSGFEGDVGGRVATFQNWTQAALVVGVWNLAIGVTLAVPVAAFAASINQEPVFDRDRKVWVWEFNYDFVGTTYTAELTGALIAGGVEWKMYISREGGFQDFLWYSGQMDTGGTSGYWELNRSPDSAVRFLRIDWEKEAEAVGSITYTDVTAGSANNGSYIEYGKTTGGEYNTFYNLFSASDESSINIEWNDETGAGRIKINAGEFECWDENLEDVDCG